MSFRGLNGSKIQEGFRGYKQGSLQHNSQAEVKPGAMEMITDDEEGSVVTVVASVVTCVESANFRQVEDEVNHEEEVGDEVEEVVEEVVEEEDAENQSGDYQFGGNHQVCVGSLLSKRLNKS